MSNKTCSICYNHYTNDNLKCKTCKNEVCDDCYANIVFNEDEFTFNFMQDKLFFKCPFCVSENNFSTNINNFNINNKLIKLLIEWESQCEIISLQLTKVPWFNKSFKSSQAIETHSLSWVEVSSELKVEP